MEDDAGDEESERRGVLFGLGTPDPNSGETCVRSTRTPESTRSAITTTVTTFECVAATSVRWLAFRATWST